ncbi:MAG: O-acetyl-ADP-ribose deacetylase [Candidatus Omnitrophota bacterium]
MIRIKQGDITKEKADVIVNAANSALAGGGGVDGAIHRAAGPAVMEACRKIGGCPTGKAVMTTAGALKAQAIFHAVGPRWKDGKAGESVLLRSCYAECFRLAIEHGFRSIAFPAISTGVYGYPKDEAARIALSEGYIHEKDFDEILFLCFSDEDEKIYQKIKREITERSGGKA